MNDAILTALSTGDLSALSQSQRNQYYQETCVSLGLNPLTRPFGYLVLNGKLQLYSLKGCADQLRSIHKISLEILSMGVEQDLFMVHIRGKDPTGRVDEDVGFALIKGKSGDDLGNAKLRAITKAKRRTTLSICGLGMLDETEVASIPGAITYPADQLPERLPDPVIRPTASQATPLITADAIDRLLQLADACQEPKDAFAIRMRQIMDLPEETRISKRVLRDTLTDEQYDTTWQYYTRRLHDHVDQDVPTPMPPTAVIEDPVEMMIRQAIIQGIPEADARALVAQCRDVETAQSRLTDLILARAEDETPR